MHHQDLAEMSTRTLLVMLAIRDARRAAWLKAWEWRGSERGEYTDTEDANLIDDIASVLGDMLDRCDRARSDR